jgi:hypothetical protein
MDEGRSGIALPEWSGVFAFAREESRDALRAEYPMLADEVTSSTERAILRFALEMTAILIRCAPRIVRFEHDSDSMGGSSLFMEAIGNGMRMTMSHEYSLGESWQSVERQSNRYSLEGHPFTTVSLDLDCRGSGAARVALYRVERCLVPEVEALCETSFEYYRDSRTWNLVRFGDA